MKILQTSAIIASSLGVLLLLGQQQTKAEGCDVIVTAPASIQEAIDANPGKTVCLDDSNGEFREFLIFGTEDSGTTLMAEPGDSPVLDGSIFGWRPGIILDGGVSNVTINGLEVRNFGTGIAAESGPTKGITIQGNLIRENPEDGLAATSGGDYYHEDWLIEDNVFDHNGDDPDPFEAGHGLRMINVTESTVQNNVIRRSGANGLTMQARNRAGVGEVVLSGLIVRGNFVSYNGSLVVEEEDGQVLLEPDGVGIFLQARVDDGGTALLEDSLIQDNYVEGSFETGIRVRSRSPGASVANITVKNNHSVENQNHGIYLDARGGHISGAAITDNTLSNNDLEGIRLRSRADGLLTAAAVAKNLVMNNGAAGLFLQTQGWQFNVRGWHYGKQRSELSTRRHPNICL